MRAMLIATVLCLVAGEAFALDCKRLKGSTRADTEWVLDTYRNRTPALKRDLERCKDVWARERSGGGLCLSVDTSYGTTGAWVNQCNHGVTVKWRTAKGHKGLKWVEGDGLASAYLRNTGRITWSECRSDRPYAVTPTAIRGKCR